MTLFVEIFWLHLISLPIKVDFHLKNEMLRELFNRLSTTTVLIKCQPVMKERISLLLLVKLNSEMNIIYNKLKQKTSKAMCSHEIYY